MIDTTRTVKLVDLVRVPIHHDALYVCYASDSGGKPTWRNELGTVVFDYAPREDHALVHLSSLVKEFATDLMTGAAKSTIGTMVAQATSQEVNQSLINEASVAARKKAMAEAIADVIPDWITANRKWA